MSQRKKYYLDSMLPEDKVPPELTKKGLYKPAGYACRDCSFASKKKGFSGRQSLRAHLKKHRIEQRAWRRPLFRQLLVVLILVGLAIAGGLGVEVPSEFPFVLPVVTFPEAIAAWSVVGMSIALLLLLVGIFVFGDERVGGKAVADILDAIAVIGALIGLYVVAGFWEIVFPSLSWPMQVPVWVLVALTPILAALSGLVRLLVRRRGRRSSSYSPLVEPKNALARFDIWQWRNRRQSGVNGRRGIVSSSTMEEQPPFMSENPGR